MSWISSCVIAILLAFAGDARADNVDWSQYIEKGTPAPLTHAAQAAASAPKAQPAAQPAQPKPAARPAKAVAAKPKAKPQAPKARARRK